MQLNGHCEEGMRRSGRALPLDRFAATRAYAAMPFTKALAVILKLAI